MNSAQYLPRYTADIHVPPIEVVRSHVASTLMVILHGINKRGGKGYLGMAFPEFNDESFGNVIRIVSYKHKELMNYITHPVIDLMIKNQSATASSIRKDEEGAGEYRFARDRRPDRRKIGHWINQGYTEQQASEIMAEIRPIEDTLHSIWMRGNKGDCYKIYIRKEFSSSRQDGLFSSYGLSNGGVTVPA